MRVFLGKTGTTSEPPQEAGIRIMNNLFRNQIRFSSKSTHFRSNADNLSNTPGFCCSSKNLRIKCKEILTVKVWITHPLLLTIENMYYKI